MSRWALGIVAHELLTGRSPWSSLVNKKQIRLEIRTLAVSPPSFLSVAAQAFIGSLLQRNHFVRLGSVSDDELLRAPFFASIDFEALVRVSKLSQLFPPERTNF